MSVAFDESKHPRGRSGRFRVVEHSEPETDLIDAIDSDHTLEEMARELDREDLTHIDFDAPFIPEGDTPPPF